MKQIFLSAAIALAALLPAGAQLTLERSIELAEQNYPLIKKYDLVAKTGEINLSDINKTWLPRLGIYGQATVQNPIASFPDALTELMRRMGNDIQGLDRLQYKVGLELNQTIWDGGQSAARRTEQRAATRESEAALQVQMYAIHNNVENLYFGILLLDEQMARTRATIELLQSNLACMRSMVANGVALPSEADMIEAKILTMEQTLTEAGHSADAYRTALGLYLGQDIKGLGLERPAAELPPTFESNRPELMLYDSRIALNEARLKGVKSSVMPRIGFFAQAYYGYPGFNTFEDMTKRNLSLNAIAGIKVTWNIDSFYSKKNSTRKLALATEQTRTDREVFLFNSRIQTARQTEAISSLRRVMESDSRIVELQGNVRKAAESQLANGVIDATTLLAKITDENVAQLNSAYHEIQLIQTIFQLKNTLNR